MRSWIPAWSRPKLSVPHRQSGVLVRRLSPHRGIAIVVALAITMSLPFSTNEELTAASSGVVTGTVFNDYDVDGSRRLTNDTANYLKAEPGVSGVTVRAFDATGALVGTTNTTTSGTYSLSVSSASTNDVRIEFTVPSGFQPSFSPSGESTVQFVSVGATNVNLGIQVPTEYCQSNPLVACSLVDDTVGTFGSIRTFNWSNTGTTTNVATNTETGAIWGLAWHPYSRKLFSAAAVRRMTKVYESPAGTPRLGQLFLSGNTSSTTQPYVDVATLGVDVGTIPNWTTRNTAVNGVLDGFAPNGTWDLTGKVGIGDIDVSPDGSHLWFVNLYDRKLYGLNIGGPTITPGSSLTSADVSSYTLPDPGCVNGVFRPWAIGVHDDASVFVGGVCTAENSGTRANMEAVVYRFNPSLQTFGSQPVLRFRLDYTKGNAHYSPSSTSGFANLNDRWYPWWETPNSGSYWWSDRGAMPILSDIEFSSDGAMSLGFLDRMAQRGQSANAKVSGLPGRSGITNWFWSSGGDILRACTANQQTWQIEPLKPTISSYACTISGTTYFTGKSHSGQQPGEQEFFDDTAVEYYSDATYGFYFGHVEGALGGLATYPRSSEVVGTFYDPNGNIFSGGTRWFAHSNGARRTVPSSTTGDRQLVNDSSGGEGFGKAGGLGDIEVLCDAAPLQIGNRVWNDADNDGIQDPGEMPIAGVTVRLYDTAGILVSTAVTDAKGEYRFSSTVTEAANGGTTPDATGGNLLPLTAYTIRLDNPANYTTGQPLGESYPTRLNATTIEPADIEDLIDADAILSSTSGGTTYGVDYFPQISVPSLLPGFSTHSFDFGFGDPSVSVGDTVWFDTDVDGVQDAGEPGLSGITVTLTDANGNAVTDINGNVVGPVTTNSQGKYVFDSLLAGQYKTIVTVPTGYLTTTPTTATSRNLLIGEQDTTLDFGVYKPSVSVGDTVWYDTDADGVQDAGETGLSGVTLTITDMAGNAVTNVFGQPVTTAVTDANGQYMFANLPVGQYKMTPTAPSNHSTSTADSLSSSNLSTHGSSDMSLDFGFYKPIVSVGDTVWFDLDNDGVQDAGESGIPGVTVTIKTAVDGPVTSVNGQSVTTAVTDSNGNYSFTDLPPGQYKVIVTPLSGFTSTTPTTSTSTNMATHLESDQSLDFGFFKPSVSVGDTVWFDVDNDGIQDAAEPGIAGVTLTLTTAANAAVTNIFGQSVSTVTTDANGKYSFTNLPLGSYKVTVATPSGFVATVSNAVGDVSIDSSTGSAVSANLQTHGTSDQTLDFGFYSPKVSIGNKVWFDTNDDGLQDVGEPGLSGVTLTITTAAGGPVTDIFGRPVTTTTTDANGQYLFDNLPVGQYKVSVTGPVGLTSARALQGSNRATDSSTGSATSSNLTTDGATDQTLDFGFYAPPVVVGSRVWVDANRNGIQDPGESGLAGVVLKITRADGSPVLDVLGNPVSTTTTDTDGNYIFSNLPTGVAYVVNCTMPSGYVATIANVGSDTSTDSSTGSATSQVMGQNVLTDFSLDFGVVPVVSVGDVVWRDVNRDGIKDAGEAGILGVTVTITRVDGSPVTDVFGNSVTSTTTNADGHYLFRNLPAGQYKVVVTTPQSMTATTSTSMTSMLLTAGNSDLSLDFGFATSSTPSSATQVTPASQKPSFPIAPKLSDRTTPSRSLTFAPFSLGTPSTGATFVASKIRLASQGTPSKSSSWVRRLSSKDGVWSISGDRVIFMPAKGFAGKSSIAIKLVDSTNSAAVGQLTAYVVAPSDNTTLPTTGRQLSELWTTGLLLILLGWATLVMSRRTKSA